MSEEAALRAAVKNYSKKLLKSEAKVRDLTSEVEMLRAAVRALREKGVRYSPGPFHVSDWLSSNFPTRI